jgi:hypothetical protein
MIAHNVICLAIHTAALVTPLVTSLVTYLPALCAPRTRQLMY